MRVETADGSIAADTAIVTLPSALLAEERVVFTPGLPAKTEAAAGLPLGLADKLFLSLSDAGEFEKDSRLFGRTDRSGTATYHVRPFGRPQIEAYFAATLAAELETAGEDAFLDFAVGELVGLLGSDFARRIKPLHLHRWGIDPLAGGSYSYALPGKADCRHGARRAGGRSFVLRRRGVFDQRLFDRARCLSHRRRRRRPGDRRAARQAVGMRAPRKDFHRGQRENRCHKPPTYPTPFIWSAASD